MTIKEVISTEIEKLIESENKILKKNKMDDFIFNNRDRKLSDKEKDDFINKLLNYTFVTINKTKLENFIVKNFLGQLKKLDDYNSKHKKSRDILSRNIRIIINTLYDYEMMLKDYPSQKERKKLDNRIRYLDKIGKPHSLIQPENPYSKIYMRETLIQALNPIFTQKKVDGEFKPYQQTLAKKIKHIVDCELPLNIIK